MIGNITVFDCTFREAGYQTGWFFDEDFCRDYYKFAQSAGIDYLELGFFHNKEADPNRGHFRYCSLDNEEIKNIFSITKNTVKLSAMRDIQRPLSDLLPKKETVITKITDKQYDIKGEQKRLRRKKTYREYGYQRLYLLEKIKVSTMILMVILMILCIVLILRFFSLDMERYSRNLQETQTVMVCEDITTKLELLNSEGPLEVRLKIKNNSGKPIRLNPNRLVLKDSTSDSFSLHGSGDKATQIIKDGKSATITMKYNTKNEAGFYIEAIFDDENLEEQCVQSIQIGGVVDV